MANLEIRSVSKEFKTGKVLDRISLSAENGEIVSVFGPSGAGKTVLLRLIAGVEQPDGGSILLGGRDVTDQAPEARGVGMAFQNFALFPHMSAFDNIASALTAHKAPREMIRAKVEKVAALLKIEHVLGHAPRELSNGQKQRTALARALVAEPKILLLDDPLRNVDAKLRYEMRLELPSLLKASGSTVLYVTQDYKEAMALGDRIAVLSDRDFAQIARPADPGALSDEEWANFLYFRSNPKGVLAERWRHAHGCGRFFNCLRDTLSDKILAVYKAGEPRPDVTGERAERRE